MNKVELEKMFWSLFEAAEVVLCNDGKHRCFVEAEPYYINMWCEMGIGKHTLNGRVIAVEVAYVD